MKIAYFLLILTIFIYGCNGDGTTDPEGNIIELQQNER